MFKDRLKKLRIERGLTQAKVAEAIGVTSATIGNYEQGLRQPRNNETWKKLADFFNVPVDELMDDYYTPGKTVIVESKKQPEEELKYREDVSKIIYEGVDLTALVFPERRDSSFSITKEQRDKYLEFISLSGSVFFARRKLIEILEYVRQANIEDVKSNLQYLENLIKSDVLFWFQFYEIDLENDFFKVNSIDSLYNLLLHCINFDMMAASEFYMYKLSYDYSWLRERMQPNKE